VCHDAATYIAVVAAVDEALIPPRPISLSTPTSPTHLPTHTRLIVIISTLKPAYQHRAALCLPAGHAS